MLGRSSDRALQQMGDVSLKERVGLQADRVLVALGFEEIVKVGQGKRRISPKEAPLNSLYDLWHGQGWITHSIFV